MSSSNKYLSKEKRRAMTVEAVVELAGEQNPSEITTAAIANRMGLTQVLFFAIFQTRMLSCKQLWNG